MPIEVELPDGTVVEFPDGTDQDTMRRALSRHVATSMAPVERFAAPEMAGRTPPPRPGVVEDVAKSVGSGLVKGVLAVGSLPGNIELLGRMGVDAGARTLGFEDPKLSEGAFLPHYGHYKADLERRIGTPLYDPKTTAGEYAGTIAEFVPGAARIPGSLAQRAGSVTGAGVVSETAGQVTEGTSLEPWARMAGAMVGAGLPNATARAYTPNPTSPERQAAVQTLRGEGVTSLTAGEITGSKPLRYLEQHANDIPFSGGRAGRLSEQAAEQFTAAALRRAGTTEPSIAAAIAANGGNISRATSETVDALFSTLGQRFEDLATISQARLTQSDRARMQRAVRTFEGLIGPNNRPPAVAQFLQDITGIAGRTIPGPVAASYRRQLEDAARAFSRSNNAADQATATALRELRNTLDDAIERSLPQATRGQWQQTRNYYRNLLTIERAAGAGGENAALGLISPAQLRIATQAVQGRRNYARGQGDFADLARAGAAVMADLPNSGTPARLAAGAVGSGIGQVIGGLAGGVPGQALGGVLGPLGSGLAARAFMSQPMQNYLGANARMQPAVFDSQMARAGIAPLALSPFAYYGGTP